MESRFKTAVLLAGGVNARFRPEVSQFNYLPRVKTPTLMMNGKYKHQLSAEASTIPMFDLLGSGEKQLK